MLSNKVSEIMTTDLVKATVSATVFERHGKPWSPRTSDVSSSPTTRCRSAFSPKRMCSSASSAPAIDAKKASIKDVMTTPVRAVREETHIVDAFARMYRGKYRHLLVRGRRGKIIGIVSMRRILNIAVELGQGISETRTVGDIPAAPIVTVDESSTVQATVEFDESTGSNRGHCHRGGNAHGNFYRARRAQAGRDNGHGSAANAGQDKS